MNRAAVIIAVKNAGSLPELQAAAEGAKKMAKWAKAQKFDPVVTITDARSPVTAAKIKKVIEDLVESSSYEQLFIYFAGHGVNLHYSEYWLLSKAPKDTQEAVNVASSVHLAKRCGIPHVVLISDACRTAPEGIRAQAIRGSEIFPNEGRGGLQKAVDVFYASLLGEPALEIQDKKDSAARYVSLYTEELVAALQGDRRGILTPDAADPSKVYLRPHQLKRHLSAEVPKLVAAKLGARATHSQTPDAEILSDELAFLQVFDGTTLPSAPEVPKPKPRAPGRGPLRLGPRGKRSAAPAPAPTLAEIAATALHKALNAKAGAGGRAAGTVLRRKNIAATKKVTEAVAVEVQKHADLPARTRCGFDVRGASLVAVHAPPQIGVEQLSSELATIDTGTKPATNVLLVFADGRSVVLPAIRDFLTRLTFEGDELRNVSYEPAPKTKRWNEFVKKRKEMASLRALIASSVHMGTFRLESADAPKLTEKIRILKGLDPTMALYAAYSYHRQGRPELIRDMEMYVMEDLGVTLFDLALLADRQPGAKPSPPVLPFMPMLAQGWSLLGAFDAWTDQLEELRPHVGSSLWTVFNKGALKLLKTALKG